MLNYVLRRLALMVPTLLGILLVSFVIIQFVPGGPVEQLVHQLQGASQGAEGGGASAASGYRGRQGLVQKLPVSISLGVWSFFIVYLVSITLGIAKAVRDGSRFDLWTTTAILVGYAVPGFVLGVALLVLFGGGSFLSWFPLRGLTSDDWESLSLFGKVMDYFWHLVMPLTCLVAGSFAVTTLLTKNVMLEEIRRQYVATARAKGLGEQRILYRHVLRNALIPLVTGFPAAFIGAFFTGSLLIETLFSLDGLGLLSYESVVKRDYPVVLGMLYLFSLIGLLTRLITDVAYTWVDPRVKFSGSGR